jgi:hypothetical protein
VSQTDKLTRERKTEPARCSGQNDGFLDTLHWTPSSTTWSLANNGGVTLNAKSPFGAREATRIGCRELAGKSQMFALVLSLRRLTQNVQLRSTAATIGFALWIHTSS